MRKNSILTMNFAIVLETPAVLSQDSLSHCYKGSSKEYRFETETNFPSQELLPVSLFLSSEFLGLSSSSDHLSPSSPTAKIVSPSSDSRGRGEGA